MDLSAFIFVALAVAWAAYLLPKALKHHDEAVRSRSVDRFSHTMRVLARREPVDRRNARLVVTPGRPASSPVVSSKRTSAPVPAAPASARPEPVRRATARRSAARRRNVLAVLLLATLVVAGLAGFGVVAPLWVAVPVAVVAAWLVTCRLMVKQERRVRVPHAAAPRPTASAAVAAPVAPVPAEERDDVSASLEDTSSMPAVQVPEIDPTLWDPVPVTLPTYVTKPAAVRRTVRTIDLDDSGVWTSGRTDVDAAIAREAHAADQVARTRRDEGDAHRAVGS